MSEIQPRIPNSHYPDDSTSSSPTPAQDLVITEKDNLVSIANAIREKAELTDNFAFPQGFIDAISGIESGGGDNPFKTGTFITRYSSSMPSKYTIGTLEEFGFSENPNFYACFVLDPSKIANSGCILLIEYAGSCVCHRKYMGSKYTNYSATASALEIDASSGKVTLMSAYDGMSAGFPDGVEYRWILGVL